ncbi:hypothetical protein ADU59_18880 [Pararhizobium polonicum]|uniref:TNase-like domain-containing protein n=2 Tax=Pararhizobium polonicum TaxID=1612624 RepID=A0A1C7P252_9HYPH|nr:hypothetical protein ADU59_18880 [Pararhizobium polonicum]
MQRMARLIRDLLLTALILLFIGLIVVRLDSSQGETMSGRARIVDGDTLVLDGKRIRLTGIDAPELRQVCRRGAQDWPCGTEARDRLRGLIGAEQTICAVDGADRYGRLLAVCSARNRDLNAAMVAGGYAVAFGKYAAEEDAARRDRLGLWAGTFDAPRTWRQTHGGMDEAPHRPDNSPDTLFQQFGDRVKAIFAGLWNG